MSIALLACACSSAEAAKWDVVPTLSLGETYTDNLSLTPDSTKRSDWVTQLIPGIAVTAEGTGLKLDAAYHPELLYFARDERDSEIFQRGHALGTAELAPDLLFLDFGVRVDQYDASLQSPQTTSNVNLTGNRSTVQTYEVSPYVRHDFGSQAQGEARFKESLVKTDEDASGSSTTSTLSESVADRIDLGLKSGPAYKRLTWDLKYFRENIDYEVGQDTTAEQALANARRLLTSTVGLVVLAGYESYDMGEGVQESEGAAWGLGLEWSPSPNTHIAATVGERFYGDAYYLDIKHRTRLSAWSIGYSESVTSTRNEFFVASTTSSTGYLNTLFATQYDDPEAREKAVADFVARTGMPTALNSSVNFFSNQLFIVKRWQASAGMLGVRNVLIANLFSEDAEILDPATISASAGDFSTSGSVIQAGAGVIWNWRMSARDAWNLNASFSRNEFPDTSRIDHLAYAGASVTRQLQPRLFASLNYRRQQRNSNAAGEDYTENAVFAAIQQRF